MKTTYPNLTIVHFSFSKSPYSVFLKTQLGTKLIANGCQTIEQAGEIAQQWATDLKIPVYQRKI